MPWEHCGVAFILDTEVCPACGLDKASWTVQLDKTRTLRLGAPKKKGNWIELELLDAEGRPVGGQPYACELANGVPLRGELDAEGRVRLKRLYPGPCRVRFPGVSLRGARWRQSDGPAVALPEPDGAAGRRPSKLSFADRRTAGPGLAEYALRHPGAARLRERPEGGGSGASPDADAGWRPWRDDLVLTRAQLKAGAGQRYTFQTARPGVKVDLPLAVRFRTLRAAQRSLLSHPVEVQLDGERVAAGSFAESASRVVVQFHAPVGEHTVVVYSRAQARGDGKRRRPLVYAARTVRVERS